MEAFKIWAVLDLKGNALKKMEAFTVQTEKATKALAKLRNLTTSLNTKLNVTNDTFKSINPELRAYNTTLREASASTQSLTQKTSQLNREIKSTTVSAKRGHKGGMLHLGKELGLGKAVTSYAAAGAAGVAAYGGIELLRSGFEQQSEFERIRFQLKNQGVLNPSQVSDAISFAKKNRPGISTNQMLEAIRDASMATQNYDMAKFLAPSLARANLNLNMLFGKTMSSHQQTQLVNFAEMRGGSDKSAIKMWQEIGSKIVQLSGGRLKPSDLSMFQRRAGGVSGQLTPLGMASLEPILQELTGGTTGFGYRTLSNKLIAGIQLSNNAADALQKAGIISGVKYSKTGRVMGTKYTSMDPKLEKLLQTDPVMFEKSVEQKLAKIGITSGPAIQKYFMTAFGSLPGVFMWGIHKNFAKIMRERKNFLGMPSPEQVTKEGFKTLSGSQKALSAAFQSFTRALVELSAPSVIKGLNALTSGLRALTQLLNWENTIAKNLGVNKFNWVDNAGFNQAMSNRKKGVGVWDTIKQNLGLSSKVDPTKTPASNSASAGNVYLDKNKIVGVILPAMYDHINLSGNVGSPAYSTPSIGLTSVSLNNPGGV